MNSRNGALFAADQAAPNRDIPHIVASLRELRDASLANRARRGNWSTLQAQIEVARQAGVGAVMMAPMLIGLPVFHEISSTIGLPVLAHPAFGGTRIAMPLLLGKLFRLFGADAPGVRLCFVQKADKDSAPLREGTVGLETGVVGNAAAPKLRVQAMFRVLHERRAQRPLPGSAIRKRPDTPRSRLGRIQAREFRIPDTGES
jgi:hypothetical protein